MLSGVFKFPFPSCYWQTCLLIDDATSNWLFTVTIMHLIWVFSFGWILLFVSVRLEGTTAISEMQNDISNRASICMRI